MSVAFCHIRFVNAFEAQGIDRSTLSYRGELLRQTRTKLSMTDASVMSAPFGKYGSWFALICTAIVCFFKMSGFR